MSTLISWSAFYKKKKRVELLCALICFQLSRRVDDRQVMYGGIDTYLLWKLTGEKVFATEYSNICSSAFYDPFSVCTNTLYVYATCKPFEHCD